MKAFNYLLFCLIPKSVNVIILISLFSLITSSVFSTTDSTIVENIITQDSLVDQDTNSAIVNVEIDIEEEIKSNPDFLNEMESSVESFGWLFLLSFSILILAILELFLFKITGTKYLPLFLIVVSLFTLFSLIPFESVKLGLSEGYEPDQPINFSHKIHSGDNKISCFYCHIGATESKHSSIPSASLCLNCHNVIRKGTNTGTEEIAKIHKAVESGKPIKWVKVHNLPDHVFFSHAQHVAVGKLDCKECHGDVEKMGRIKQVNALSMGWCIDCHRNKAVQFESNEYYSSYRKVHEALKNGEIDSVTVDYLDGNDCQKCHY